MKEVEEKEKQKKGQMNVGDGQIESNNILERKNRGGDNKKKGRKEIRNMGKKREGEEKREGKGWL